MKVRKLEELATDMVGDNKKPNLFFVSVAKQGVVLVTRDFQVAYGLWKTLPRNMETTLEDRQYGTICTTEPKEDGSEKLVTIDDSRSFLKMKRGK